MVDSGTAIVTQPANRQTNIRGSVGKERVLYVNGTLISRGLADTLYQKGVLSKGSIKKEASRSGWGQS